MAKIYTQYFLAAFLIVMLNACSNQPEKKESPLDRSVVFEMETDLIIGQASQSQNHQLGRPVSVRTDSVGNIYIADAEAMTVKVFDSTGVYKNSLGGRGRGPGEFLDIQMMDLTAKGNLVLLDKGNFRYTTLSKDGAEVASNPVDLSSQSSQYYPNSLAYFNSLTVGLDLNGAVPSRSPIFERDLFHIYNPNFQTEYYSFGKFKRLGHLDTFAWCQIAFDNTGSFILSKEKQELVYSPGIYDGKLYVYRRLKKGRWDFKRTLQGVSPGIQPYIKYASEEEHKAEFEKGLPGVKKTYYGEGPHMGKVNSLEAGIFRLQDGRIIQFFGKWRQERKSSFGSAHAGYFCTGF